MKFKMTLNISLLLLVCSGCNGTQEQLGIENENNDRTITQVHTSKPIDQSSANQAKEMVIKKEEVSDVKAVNTKKELLLAVKVEQFERFRLKKIKKELTLDLERIYPNHKILVSTDSKIFLELKQLEDKIKKNSIELKKLEKEFKSIKSLMEEKA